jgi:CheY-like chemotaxis protein
MSSNTSFNRIIIIDDDTTSVFLTKFLLEDMNIARQILTASDGQEGLCKINEHCLNAQAASVECPDLILIDIHMPVMDGVELIHALRTIGQTNLMQAKLVVLTTSSNPRDIEQMKALGIVYYLEKPISEEEILLLAV